MFSGSIFFQKTLLSAQKEVHNKIKERKFILKILLDFFFGIKLFLGHYTFSNVNVLNKGLLLQDWVFRLGETSSSLNYY